MEEYLGQLTIFGNGNHPRQYEIFVSFDDGSPDAVRYSYGIIGDSFTYDQPRTEVEMQINGFVALQLLLNGHGGGDGFEVIDDD